MKKFCGLLLVLAFAGCASAPAEKASVNGGVGPAQGAVAPRYEHQLDGLYTEGATWFLRVVPVREP